MVSTALSSSYEVRRTASWQVGFDVLATDRLGWRVYAINGVGASITFDLQVGDSTVSFVDTPLALRHSQLRGLNDDLGFLHITSTEKAKYESAYSQRLQWDGGNTNLVASTGRASLGLGTAAVQNVGYFVLASEKGSIDGVAELDANGFVKNTQLPSYVDDVLEYANYASLPLTGETGKIYITLDTNLTYRWTGSTYAEISQSLALGETSSTAYRGDRGKIAYDHTSLTNNPHSVTYLQVGAEAYLGIPSVNGYLLSSTNAGSRVWVAPYSLPTASSTTLGGVKIGSGVTITDGVISVTPYVQDRKSVV